MDQYSRPLVIENYRLVVLLNTKLFIARVNIEIFRGSVIPIFT